MPPIAEEILVCPLADKVVSWAARRCLTPRKGPRVSIPVGLLLLGVFMLLSAGGLILVQRLVPIAVRRQHNDVVGFLYAVGARRSLRRAARARVSCGVGAMERGRR